MLIEGDESEGERAAAVDVLQRKYRQYREMDIAGNPVVKLTPERVTAWGGDGNPMVLSNYLKTPILGILFLNQGED